MLKEQLLLIGSMGIGTGCVLGAFVSFLSDPGDREKSWNPKWIC